MTSLPEQIREAQHRMAEAKSQMEAQAEGSVARDAWKMQWASLKARCNYLQRVHKQNDHRKKALAHVLSLPNLTPKEAKRYRNRLARLERQTEGAPADHVSQPILVPYESDSEPEVAEPQSNKNDGTPAVPILVPYESDGGEPDVPVKPTKRRRSSPVVSRYALRQRV